MIISISYFRKKLDEYQCNSNLTAAKISAIIPVHVWGNACSMDQLVELCNKQNIAIVEDACESLGTFYNGVKKLEQIFGKKKSAY